EVLRRAAARSGLSTRPNLEACVAEADLVFVSTPIPTIAALAARALVEAPNAVVTDVGSVKSHVLDEVETGAPLETLPRFVGGHPMGGSERSGPDGASPSVVDGIVWVLTPRDRTDPDVVLRLETWIGSVGARPIRMEPERHDRLVA